MNKNKKHKLKKEAEKKLIKYLEEYENRENKTIKDQEESRQPKINKG